MQKPDIEKLEKIVNKCSAVHSGAGADVDLARAIQKGYQIAYDLMTWANKNKDKALAQKAYKLSQDLIPESSKLDSVVLSQIKEQKYEFLEKVVKLFIDRPETILNPTKRQLESNLNNAQDTYEQQNLTARLNNINDGIGEIQFKRGIVCKESTAFFNKIHKAKVAAVNKYYEDLKVK